MAVATAATATANVVSKTETTSSVKIISVTEQKVAAKDAQELLDARLEPVFCSVYVSFNSAFITRLVVNTGKEYIEIKPKLTNVNQEPVCCIYDPQSQSQLVPSYSHHAVWRSPDVLMTGPPFDRQLHPATLENGLIVPTTWDYQIVTSC